MGPAGVLLRLKTIAAVKCAALCNEIAPMPNMPVEIMGMTFANPLGLAAGFDRTGMMLPQLSRLGFGHAETGTVGPAGSRWLCRPKAGPLRVGVNIGSRRAGLGDEVIADYCAAFRAVYEKADYVSVNLTSPLCGRHGDSPGVERLIGHLRQAQEDCAAVAGRRVPLMLKVAFNGAGVPAAAVEAKQLGLDGLVLVSSSLREIASMRDFLAGAAVVSVGGVRSADDVRARIAAGASLVQLYTAFLREGPSLPARLLAELKSTEVCAP